MRFNPILVIAAILFTASVAFGQNDPSYYRINGTDAYVNPNLGGYADGGYGNGGFFGDGYNNRISPKAQNILAIGQTAFMVGSLFKKSPQEAQAKAAVEIEKIRAFSPISQSLARRNDAFTAQEAKVSSAVAARTYAGAHLEYKGGVSADGASERAISLTGGQVASSMSLSPDYDAYEAPRSRKHRTVSMAGRGRRRQVEEPDDLIALIRERHDRRSDQSERATKISVSTPDDEPETPKPPKKQRRRAKKTVETTTVEITAQGGPSFGGRERPPWDE